MESQVTTSYDMCEQIRADYTLYKNASPEFKRNLPNSIDALSACIVQCRDKREDHRRKIYLDFSKYVSKQAGVPLMIVDKNDGPRVIIKRKKSLRDILTH